MASGKYLAHIPCLRISTFLKYILISFAVDVIEDRVMCRNVNTVAGETCTAAPLTHGLEFHIQFLKINPRQSRQRRSKFKPQEAKEEVHAGNCRPLF